MDHETSRAALRLGFGSAVLLVLFEVLYAVALGLGLRALDSPADPIGDPFFTAMELLILLLVPPLMVLPVAVHATARAEQKPFALAAVAFGAVLAAITASVHASILLLSRTPPFAEMRAVFAFEWPSVVYVLDILAWDVFFALYAGFLALAFGRRGIERWVRGLLLVSAGLALAGLWGAATGDMQARNIGVVGYVPVFTIAVGLMAIRFRQRPRAAL